MNKLKQTLEKILKQEEFFCDSETKEISYTKVKDSADKIDPKLIALLADHKETKEKFFTKIKDVYVFNVNDFKFFLDENKINNSYTQFANQIGLSDGADFLKDRSEVVLGFPYKDCVLEGGQSTEEGIDTFFEYSDKSDKYEEKTAKRSEVFFNQVLARDEIDRLFDKKALVSWKRYTKDSGKDGEAVKELERDENGMMKENFIIKGNNLLALHSLKSEFSGKVKLIYIDPPYNTGNDGFKYNDSFNHSTWLSFMKNRLEIAKDLLKDDGFMFVQCDDSEQSYLKILLDDIFGRENYRNSIYWHRTYAGKTISKNLPWNIDTILFYSKNPNSRINNITKELNDTDIASFNKDDNDGRGKYNTVSMQKTGGPGPQTTYDYKDNVGRIWKCPQKGWRMTKEKLKALENEGRLYITDKTIREKYYLNERLKIGKQIDNLWGDIGNMNRSKGEDTGFSGQKPEKLLQRIFDLTTTQRDLVLDFFAGTGTTLAVAHKTGRQYIGIEQMDYIHDLPESRLKEVVKGEQMGISKSVNWQGGGSFIYCELAKWNEQAKDEINKAEDYKALEKMFDALYEKYFFNYNVKIKEFKEKVLKEENFKKLTLDEQKRIFLTMLDLNQMYVQESEMADKRYEISKEDQRLTKEFYSK
jgi:adenine-specific DNA-methyltransferase